MEPQRVDPLTGVLNFFKAVADNVITGENKSRLDAMNTEVENITIDTCKAGDTEMWETGIERMSIEGQWLIVEQYPDREAAEIGHQKWIDLMTEYPDYPLKDIDMWSLE